MDNGHTEQVGPQSNPTHKRFKTLEEELRDQAIAIDFLRALRDRNYRRAAAIARRNPEVIDEYVLRPLHAD
jgi:hypothetical protein